ncbi:MAG: outer membrane beta-barrel protein [Deltaproteobacteria bacterium]|nr:outer membrane beta-barrel protein [Deltaproteobacteria bacterium]
MKRTILILVMALIFISTSFPGSAMAAGSFNLIFGKKSLDKSDWAPWESQVELGFELALKKESWPVSIVLSDIASVETVSDGVTAGTGELSLGVRYTTPASDNVNVFVSGGVASIVVLISNGLVDVSERGTGYWADTGVTLNVTQSFNIGARLRYSAAEAFGVKAGGFHYGATLGFNF